MPAKKKVGAKTPVDAETIALQAIEFDNCKKEVKRYNDHCSELKEPLEQYVEAHCHVTSKGHKVVELAHADVDITLTKTLRTSAVFVPEAADILRKHKLTECIEKVEVVRDDIVQRMHEEGRISDELLAQICQMKENYAFSVSVKPRKSYIDETP